MRTEPILMPLKDACYAFGVSYSSLWTAIQNGEIPGEKARGRWRVEPDHVRLWLREAPDFQTNQLP